MGGRRRKERKEKRGEERKREERKGTKIIATDKSIK